MPHLKKLGDRSVPMVYFGVEEGSKAHRLYDPQSGRIVVSRDVIFEENEVWKWDTKLGEGSEFTVEDAVGDTVQQYGGGGIGGDNQGNQPQYDSGGATDGVQGSGGEGNSVQPSEDAQPDIVTDQATDSNVSVNQHSGSEQENDDENMDIDHDDGPVRFRSLNEVYEDSVEVDLASDTEVEINALLATMEEPTCYQEAAGDVD